MILAELGKPEKVWPGLTPAQADGMECVLCGASFLVATDRQAPAATPCGRSAATGSQVFRCDEGCRSRP